MSSEATEHTYYQSPIGTIKIVGTNLAVTTLSFVETEEEAQHSSLALQQAINELDEYFQGNRKAFTVSLAPEGSVFQKRVWKALEAIPFGKTVSYQEIANQLGDPKATRAVGHANGSNPIALFLPCHRVIGSDGSLTGYAFGVERKKWLLDHESQYIQGKLF